MSLGVPRAIKLGRRRVWRSSTNPIPPKSASVPSVRGGWSVGCACACAWKRDCRESVSETAQTRECRGEWRERHRPWTPTRPCDGHGARRLVTLTGVSGRATGGRLTSCGVRLPRSSLSSRDSRVRAHCPLWECRVPCGCAGAPRRSTSRAHQRAGARTAAARASFFQSTR